MTIWFTSDMHFGHANIIDYSDRPYRDGGGNPDVPHMTEALVANWNARVAPEDEVFVLGDAVMGQRDQTLPVLARLMGHKHLVAGNHDYCWEHFKKRDVWLPKYLPYFESISTHRIHVFPDGTRANLHHFPYTGDSHQDDRYSQHRLDDDGTPLLHGHVHEAWRQKLSPKGTPMVNVGVDVHGFAPISEDEAFALLRTCS